MKIFEAIRKDHDKQKALLKLLIDTKGESNVREDFYMQLKSELERHAVAEERHFYSPLMEYDNTIAMSRHGIAEHHEIDELIAKLDETSMESSAWLVTMKALAEKVEHHLAEEEREFFQQAGKVLPETQKDSLAQDYIKEMKSL